MNRTSPEIAKRKNSIRGKTSRNAERNGKHPAPYVENLDAEPPLAGGEELILTTCGQLQARPVQYLVPGRIARGKVTLIAGRGGDGKSTLSRAVSAALSIGKPALGMDYAAERGKTLILAAEDGQEDTIVPGLIAEGADLGNVILLEGVRHGEVRHDFTLLPEHVDLLRKRLLGSPGIKLVIVDPIASFVGRTRINDHKATELRLVLDPLNALAAETGAAFIIIAHVNKANGAAVDRIAGSAAYRDAVRAAYIVARDPEDDALRLLMPVKWNLLGFDRTSIPFRLESVSDTDAAIMLRAPQFKDLTPDEQVIMRHQLSRLSFEASRAVNADDAMRRKEGGGESSATKVEKCGEFIRAYLGSFAHPSDEILAAAKSAGFTFDNVTKAKTALKETGLRHSNMGRFRGAWWSGFGNPNDWALRPEPTPESPESPDSH